MNAHAAADPGVHADESRRLDLLDVDRLGPIENRQMTSEAGLFHKVSHDRQRDFANINSTERAAAETEDFQSDAVSAAVLISIQVPLRFERAQNIAGGTLWNLKLAADFGVAKAFRLMCDRFKHGQSALNSN